MTIFFLIFQILSCVLGFGYVANEKVRIMKTVILCIVKFAMVFELTQGLFYCRLKLVGIRHQWDH